jgi:ribonuclease BN (tRNA processing enzyme)
MLDCGEGTMFQLVRLFGPDQASVVISALDFVWLSHAHADHHLGLLDIARAYHQGTGHPLKVFCPRKLHVAFRRGDAGSDAAPQPWLTLVSAWEGVPMHVTSCSDLAADTVLEDSGESCTATAIRTHVPRCELVGVVAARVDHRFTWSVCPYQAAAVFVMPLQLLRRMGDQVHDAGSHHSGVQVHA